MDDCSLLVQNDEHRESEACRIVEAFHELACLCRLLLAEGLAWVVVDVGINEVVTYNLAYCGVVGNEVCKSQTPRTPVASHLTYYILTLFSCLGYSFVHLFEWIDVFVIHFLEYCLCICKYGCAYDDK